MTERIKIAVFIDAGNLWQTYKVIGHILDFTKLSNFFAEKFDGEIFKIFYYAAYPKDGTRNQELIENIHSFFTFLKKGAGITVVKKPLKTINLRDYEGNLVYDQKTGKPQTIEKGNLDVDITIDALRYAPSYDIAIFLSGDSDFLPLISYLRNLKSKNSKKVYIFSSKNCISEELKTGGDGYFDLSDYPEIYRDRFKQKEKSESK